MVSSFPRAQTEAEAMLPAHALTLTVMAWSWPTSYPDHYPTHPPPETAPLGFFSSLGAFAMRNGCSYMLLYPGLMLLLPHIHRWLPKNPEMSHQMHHDHLTSMHPTVLPPTLCSSLLELSPSLLETQRCSGSAQSIGTATKASSHPRGTGPLCCSIHKSKLLALLKMLQQPLWEWDGATQPHAT